MTDPISKERFFDSRMLSALSAIFMHSASYVILMACLFKNENMVVSLVDSFANSFDATDPIIFAPLGFVLGLFSDLFGKHKRMIYFGCSFEIIGALLLTIATKPPLINFSVIVLICGYVLILANSFVLFSVHLHKTKKNIMRGWINQIGYALAGSFFGIVLFFFWIREFEMRYLETLLLIVTVVNLICWIFFLSGDSFKLGELTEYHRPKLKRKNILVYVSVLFSIALIAYNLSSKALEEYMYRTQNPDFSDGSYKYSLVLLALLVILSVFLLNILVKRFKINWVFMMVFGLLLIGLSMIGTSMLPESVTSTNFYFFNPNPRDLVNLNLLKVFSLFSVLITGYILSTQLIGYAVMRSIPFKRQTSFFTGILLIESLAGMIAVKYINKYFWKSYLDSILYTGLACLILACLVLLFRKFIKNSVEPVEIVHDHILDN